MFTLNHLIWLAISFILIIAICLWLKTHKPKLINVLTVACVMCVLSEFTKVFSTLKMVPSSDGSTTHVYLELGHLPFHLCSIQIIFVFMARFLKEGKTKETLLAFMYPTCLVGAFLAILMPSIFGSSIEVSQAFTHPLAYQYFLYHVTLVCLGFYIPVSKEVDIKPKHYFSTLGLLGVLAFISLYLNSMFATPTYVNDQLVSVDYSTNFFFTQRTPIGIELNEMWQWYLYIAIICTIAVVVIALFYLPYFIKHKKNNRVG